MAIDKKSNPKIVAKTPILMSCWISGVLRKVHLGALWPSNVALAVVGKPCRQAGPPSKP